MKTIETATATTAELVAFYNENAAKPVARFADRKTAERRCELLMIELRAQAQIATETEVNAHNADAQASTDDITDDITGFAEHGLRNCPGCNVHLSNGVLMDGDTTCDNRGREKVIRLPYAFECMGCGQGFGSKTRVGSKSNNSEGIAASWQNESVREARRARHGVVVTNLKDKREQHYRSVAAAYVALGLPMKEHIAFRALLKNAAGPVENYGWSWKVVAKS